MFGPCELHRRCSSIPKRNAKKKRPIPLNRCRRRHEHDKLTSNETSVVFSSVPARAGEPRTVDGASKFVRLDPPSEVGPTLMRLPGFNRSLARHWSEAVFVGPTQHIGFQSNERQQASGTRDSWGAHQWRLSPKLRSVFRGTWWEDEMEAGKEEGRNVDEADNQVPIAGKVTNLYSVFRA